MVFLIPALLLVEAPFEQVSKDSTISLKCIILEQFYDGDI